MKQFLKKFKDFKLTAKVEACLGFVSVVAALVILILYQTNQTRLNTDGSEIIISGFPGEPIVGMVFFLAGLLSIILGVVALYSSVKYIFNKDATKEPNRLIPYFGAISALFSIVEVIFAFVMISKEGSRNTIGVIIAAIFLILALVLQLLMLYPAIKVRLKEDD